MSDASERLAALSDADLADLVTAVVGAGWDGEWSTDFPPPSPDGGVDVRFERGDERRLVRVARGSTSSPVGAPAVAEAARFGDAAGFDATLFVSTGGFTPAAESVDAPDVELVGPDRLLDRAAAADVSVPPAAPEWSEDGTDDSGDGPEDDALPAPAASVLDRYAAYWPDGVAERARAIMAAIADAAAFDYAVSEADASTELACRLGGTVPVRIRFTETSLLVFVAGGDVGDTGRDAYERAVALTVHRRNQPAARLVADARAAVGEAVERRGRSDK